MKSPGLSPAIVAATLFLARAVAQQSPGEPGRSPQGEGGLNQEKMSARSSGLLARFDKNGDGKLDETELADAREVMLQEQLTRQAAAAKLPAAPAVQARMLEMFDKNHDGRLDDEERAAMRRYGEENGLGPNGEIRAELLKRFDKNADGKLDDEERAEMQRYLRNRASGPGPDASFATMRGYLLRQFDRNGNGKIDDDEMPDVERAVRPRLESNPDQVRRLDRNSDGQIDDNEWAIAREELRRMLNEPAAATTDTDASAQVRLERVAAEVAKRRAEREKAAQQAAAPKP